jgi:O-antigen ligase/tetratricopeptide (TPR) repeat protein
MFNRSATRPPDWFALAGITALAPVLGGSTQLWTQAVLLLVVAVLFIWFPPRHSLGARWNVIFLCLALLAFSGFLPAAFSGMPGWRKALTGTYGLTLPGTVSPQPWMTCEACCFYLGCLAWAYYILAQSWTAPERQKSVRFYAGTVVILAAVSLAAYLLHFKVPFWPLVGNSPINFGFFPNRNQTANVLALGAVMMTALAFESSERKTKWGLLWIPMILLTVVALVIDYSRAGVILFFGGAAVWLFCTIPDSRSKRTGALCLTGMILTLAAFLLYGGDTLRRFQPEPKDNAKQWTDFRFSIQQDAIDFANQSPVFGNGLGNFEFLFPIYRERSAAQNRALHPESDWLWTAAEMGWPAAALVLLGLVCWLPQCFPFVRKTDRRLRSAAAVCAIAFAIHGLADVSGHRAGSMFPALFFCSIALHPDRRLREAGWVTPFFRCFGLVLIAVAGWWLASYQTSRYDLVAPTSQTLERLRVRADAALAARDYPKVIATTTEALHIAPLDWRLYFRRAVASAVSQASLTNAQKDFALARYLVPQWAESCFVEGEIWLAMGKPDLAMNAWQEALKRGGEDSPALYQRMMSDRPLNAAVLPSLEDLARENREYWLVFLQFAQPLECELQISDLLGQDPPLVTLTRVQRKNLFAIWYERGNRELLISNLLAYPAWLPEGWYWVAEDYVSRSQFREAYELAMRYTPAPSMPLIGSSAPMNELERNFFYHSDDFEYGMDLYFAQRKLGHTKDELDTLLQLAKLPSRPPYILYLVSQLYAEQGMWEEAWQARVDYRPLNAE